MKNLQSYDDFLNEFESVKLKDLHPGEVQIMDLKKGDHFEYLDVEYEVIDPKKRHAKRLTDGGNCKFTPFTFMKKI